MATWNDVLRGMAVLMLTSLATNAQGFEEDTRALVELKGQILCMDCKMEEVMKTQETQEKSGQLAEEKSGKLMEIKHEKGQLIISRAAAGDGTSEEKSVTQDFDNKQQIQNRVGLGEHITLRAEEPVLQQLASQKNLHKELEIKGLLRSDRTLDAGSVKVAGVELQSKDRGGETTASTANQ